MNHNNRFFQIHNLKGQEITQLNGFYLNFCLHFEQMNGFHSCSCKHTTFGMRDECYESDKVFANTHFGGTGNTLVEWLLSELLFTLRADEWF